MAGCAAGTPLPAVLSLPVQFPDASLPISTAAVAPSIKKPCCCSLPAGWTSAPELQPLSAAGIAAPGVLPTSQPALAHFSCTTSSRRAAPPCKGPARDKHCSVHDSCNRAGWLAAKAMAGTRAAVQAACSTHLQLQRDAAHGAALDALHQVLQAGRQGGTGEEGAAGGRAWVLGCTHCRLTWACAGPAEQQKPGSPWR